MTLLRRRSPARTVEPEPQEAAPSRIRRHRVAAAPAKPADTRDYYGESVKALQSIAKLEEQIEKLTQQKEAHERHVDFLMGEGKLGHVDDGIWQADRKAVTGKSTTDIDVAKFRKYVGEEKYQSVAKVSVGDAKSLVAEKEYLRAGIKTVTGKPTGEFKTVVSRKKKK